ncbi:aldehyde ferredoxin oxidoreductase family protein [Desulfovibrio psychrotolerans]|uniref:Aldehyde ferredoxin oxidoreductase n=1 Tax=Desulfovibrio psychrotolerans TaxID=415242 RepID=A0A7J0BXZ9_9BACT|nr:aldehyde ferredoxin oxidoreductase C-terminal domain-containing protein [Desulfovibrio psychrotolerans]GFM38062.1 aldehyde ferredoxin oxidoreductase [Desulfovibrio psychrotolerans]
MNTILRVRCNGTGMPTLSTHPIGTYAGLGGRAMTSKVICSEVPADCHPLGPENKLVFAPGLMSGTAAATSGRLSVGCKSPLTGTIKEANAGGTAAQALAKLGYAAVIFEGEAGGNALYRLVIDEKGAKVEPADGYRMLPNYALRDKVQEEFGDKVSLISIGTAGEMRMSNSTIAVTDPEFRPTRHAGRGGVGAVMGSKGFKCIIVNAENASIRKPALPDAFKAANKKFVEGLKGHPVTGTGLPAYGTNILTNILNEAGGYPTRNFSTGRFDGAGNISGEAQAELERTRGGNPTHGCHKGCVIKCSGVYVDKEGNFLTKQPEYETVWSHGGNCGIDDLDAIAMMDRLDDDYGLDTIEMGATIGVAMEAGVIPFGDKEGAIDLIHQVGKGTPLGRILGAGTAVTAKCYGLERAPVVKNQAMPAYDPRAVKGMGVTYATTTQGADHTAGYAVATNILNVGGHVNPLGTEGQAELSRSLQVATAALDATGYCLFIAFAILDQAETFDAMVDSINAMYGLTLTGGDVVALGQDILRMERDFNKAAGFGPAHDRLPRYFTREPLAPHGVVFDVPEEELDSVYNF